MITVSRNAIFELERLQGNVAQIQRVLALREPAPNSYEDHTQQGHLSLFGYSFTISREEARQILRRLLEKNKKEILEMGIELVP